MFRSALTPEGARVLAVAATLFCVWLAAQAAQRIPRDRPRSFTALSLLALNWAILLLYYLPGPPEEELLSSFSGFVLILVGSHLYREARAGHTDGEPVLDRLDTLPLFLFRSTVLGFGVYFLVQRLFHREYGWSTLALALWGSALTILGYALIWWAVRKLVGLRRGTGAILGLGALLIVYSAAELTYAAWYVRDFWPPYRRYLELRGRPGAPDFQAPLPFHPQPEWPQAASWSALRPAHDGAPATQVLRLHVSPNTPDEPVWLTHLFSALKLGLTTALALLLRRRICK